MIHCGIRAAVDGNSNIIKLLMGTRTRYRHEAERHNRHVPPFTLSKVEDTATREATMLQSLYCKLQRDLPFLASSAVASTQPVSN